ncbi:MAG: hypothetical protein L0Y36_00720 [Planctomycetales bacterium]|nr:hypothetical protein [Planctomycetales bacterium]
MVDCIFEYFSGASLPKRLLSENTGLDDFDGLWNNDLRIGVAVNAAKQS